MAQIMVAPQFRRRQIARLNKASRTPGKMKGDHCQTNRVKKFFACNTKAYKHKDYQSWHEEFKRLNLGGKV